MGDWTQNPFAQNDNDPFKDPSVTSVNAAKVPEYNPFDGGAAATQAPTTTVTRDVISAGAASFSKQTTKSAPADDKPIWADTNPKPAQAHTPSPPPVAAALPSNPAQSKTGAKAKVLSLETPDEIERKREYESRENFANPINPKADPNHRPSNWPPFPEKCPTPFKPCVHHDFEGEIPRFGYRIAKEAYYFWMVIGVAYLWNFICALAGLSTSLDWTAPTAGVSSAFFVLGIPCAYCCWFHPLYSAFRTDSSLRYGWFFFSMCMQTVMSVFLSIGFPSTGAAGFWTAIACVQVNKPVGIMFFSSALLWAITALWSVWIIKRILFIYRTTGQTMEKAKGEARGIANQAAYDAITSDTGQAVVKSAAQTAWEKQAENA